MGLDDEVAVRPRLSREDEFHAKTSTLLQFRALFLKDLTLQWRSWRTNLCQFLTPIIFILFVGIIQVVVNKILAAKGTAVPGTEIPFPPANPGRMLSCQPYGSNDSDSVFDFDLPHYPKECRREVLNFFDEFPQWQQYMDMIQLLPNLTNVSKMLNKGLRFLEGSSYQPCQEVLFDLPFYYVDVSPGVGRDVLGNLTSHNMSTTKQGLVGSMVPDEWYYEFSLNFTIKTNLSARSSDTCPAPADVSDEDSIKVPLFWKVDGREELNKILADIVKDYNALANLSASSRDQYGRTYSVTPLSQGQYNRVMGYIKNKTLTKVKPQGGIMIDHYDVTPSSVDIHYTIVADELAIYKLHFAGNSKKAIGKNLSKIELDVHRRNSLINIVDNAILKQLLNDTELEDGPPLITTYIMPIPSFHQMNLTIDISSFLGGVLYPFAASFLIPVFMSSIVKDKQEKHLIMMEQNGLNRWTYWLVTYTFNYLLYIPIAIEIILFSLVFQLRLFMQTHPVVIILTFFLWGHAEVVLGFFFSNFFNRPRTAIILGYLLIIVGVIVSLVIGMLQVFPIDKNPLFVYMLYPPFAFYRLLDYFLNACINMRCYGIDILSPANGLNVVTTGMLYLAGMTIVIMILSVYFSYVLPGEYGVRKSPFFPIISVYKCLKSLKKKKKKDTLIDTEEDRQSPLFTRVDFESEEDDMDIDVQAEKMNIKENFPNDAPMVMYKLRKEYPGSGGGPPYVAVDSMSVAIDRDECFGLLGPNGAGKTTLISVLTGLYEPTSGTACIAGYDIATDIDAIHHHLGVCPQFDIHHADLTAKEHLLFYARLKGAKRSKEKEIVERALRQVNLYDARDRKSKNLSGGMKRRLSVAMAFIGNPDILILDEPTTGLDPASRRQVWDVIERVKQGRSVILTTHSMEEADYLCTRIGIMNFGKLRCLGTQTRLKTRFGTGYKLTFNCAPGQSREVENFVQLNIPNAVHVETFADTCTFKMEKEHLKVSELFPTINREKTRLGILDWGLKMSTLEDVFLKIVNQHDDHRTHTGRSLLPAWLPCLHCQRKAEDNE